MTTKCLGCGRIYKATHHLPFVKSCVKCTRKFGLDDIDGYLDKFWKG